MNPDLLDAFEIKAESHLAFPYHGILGFGACLPPGQVRRGDEFHLEDRAGSKYPLEWRALLCSDDETISWAYFQFPVALGKRQFRHFKVRPGALDSAERGENLRLRLENTTSGLTVRNGAEEWKFNCGAPLGLAQFSCEGVPIFIGVEAVMEFDSGRYQMHEPFELTAKSASSLEVVIQVEGALTHDDGDSIYLRLQYKFLAGKAGCNLNLLFSNRRCSDEQLSLQSLALRFGLSTPLTVCLVRQMGNGNHCAPRNLEIGGGVHIVNGALQNAEALEIPDKTELWPFFRKRDYKTFFSRVAPYCGVRCEAGGVLFAWQRATLLEANSFSAQDESATIELVSPTPEGHCIPQGFSRSFDLSVTPLATDDDGDKVFERAALAEYSPLVSVHPRWFIQNQVEETERVLPYQPGQHPRYEKQLWRDYAIDYFSGFYHLGDYPSGRGTLQTRVESRDFTWNNNEEDHLKGLAWMLMRTGDPSYREDMHLCARHLLEVDRIAFSQDPLRDGIFIAHAKNHFDGAGYPSHCWAEGLLLYYKLSGDDDALHAFFALCDNLLLWTELPDRKRFTDAREMGVPVTNFSHAFKLTGDEKYLRAARLYIAEWRRQMDEDGGLYYTKGAHFIPYAEYVAVEALWDFYELVGDENVKPLLIEVIEWIWSTQIDSSGVYDGRSTSESLLQVFYIAYRLTGSELWLERGRAGLDAALSQSSLHPLLKFNNNAAYYYEAMKRGWFRDELVPLEPCRSSRAVFRTYSEPIFGWEKTR